MMRYYLLAMALLALLSGCASLSTTKQSADVTIDKTFGNYNKDSASDLVLITMTPEEHAQLTTTDANASVGSLPSKYNDFLQHLHQRYGLTRVADWPLPAIDIYCIIFESEGSQSRESIVTALVHEPGVESAQIVQTFEVQAQTYNDPYLALQHGFHSIQASVSHNWSKGDGVRVAVVDTGLDNAHKDLAPSSEKVRNFVDQNDEEFRADVHGTAVGGVIAAVADNSTGMVGIAPEASLLSIKACWYAKKREAEALCNSLTLAKALNYSINEKVDIINLSLTGPPDPLLERLVRAALAQNIVVVGARPAHDEPAFPASVEGTIAVNLPGRGSGRISAPGRQVLSTRPDDQYDFYNGSSFSAAHISGLAAVIRSLSPTLSPDRLRMLLETTANPETGEVNACRAIAVLHKELVKPMVLDHCN